MAHFPRRILVTGGAGFIGSHLAVRFARSCEGVTVVAADNLKRRGAELNLDRLRAHGVAFHHCDIRCPEDLGALRGPFDLLVDCSAEPSIAAARDAGPTYVVNTNLAGTINCLDIARRDGAGVLFLSTSRVYPIDLLNALAVSEEADRFCLSADQTIPGASSSGISEAFPLEGRCSLYGATKLCSEILLREYAAMFGLPFVIDRCGVITGPWQLGKVDQGFFTLWVARHILGGQLAYFGWGGTGKQVRDILDIEDLADLIQSQIASLEQLSGEVFNIGGGPERAVSLAQLTTMCREATATRLHVGSRLEPSSDDVRLFVTDARKVMKRCSWTPRRSVADTLEAVVRWIRENRDLAHRIWA